jgi:VWFA-related protein
MRSRCRPEFAFVVPIVIWLTVSQARVAALAAQTSPPTVRSESTVVLVPTLVRTKSGDVVHGLSADDFIILDDGVQQSVHLDQSPDVDSLSLVIAVETGSTAALLFPAPGAKKNISAEPPLAGLGNMLEAFVGQDKAEVAIVTFDSQVQLVQDFSEDIPAAADKLDKLGAGDGGAALLDAVSYSADLLNHRPTNGRRALLLISETRDGGSRIAKIPNVVQEVGLSGTLVYSLAFSSARMQFMHDLHQQPTRNTDPNLLAPLMLGADSMRKNTARRVATLAGGEYATFTSARTLDADIETFAGDDRDRYMLTFQPTDPKPGPHNITVRLRSRDSAYVVTARSLYWSVARAAPH